MRVLRVIGDAGEEKSSRRPTATILNSACALWDGGASPEGRDRLVCATIRARISAVSPHDTRRAAISRVSLYEGGNSRGKLLESGGE